MPPEAWDPRAELPSVSTLSACLHPHLTYLRRQVPRQWAPQAVCSLRPGLHGQESSTGPADGRQMPVEGAAIVHRPCREEGCSCSSPVLDC